MKKYDYNSLMNISFDEDKNKLKEVAIDIFFDKYDVKHKYNSEKEYEIMKMNVLGLMIKKTTNGSLYKYRSGNDYDIDNVKNDKFTLSNPNNFNDPFEFAIIYKDLVELSKFNVFDDILRKLPTEINKKWRVGCFADTNKNLLMWSHYAKNHEGFCLEYDLYDLYEMKELLLPVKYEMEIAEESIDSSISQEFMFRKSNVWEYEGEWRIVKQATNDESYMNIDVPKVKSIYMGCKISNDLREKLIEVCKERKINLFESRVDLNKYDIIFNKVSL
jgi:hypothetical protein